MAWCDIRDRVWTGECENVPLRLVRDVYGLSWVEVCWVLTPAAAGRVGDVVLLLPLAAPEAALVECFVESLAAMVAEEFE